MDSNEPAIKTEHIGKRYRIGLKENMHDSIGAAILDFIGLRPPKDLSAEMVTAKGQAVILFKGA